MVAWRRLLAHCQTGISGESWRKVGNLCSAYVQPWCWRAWASSFPVTAAPASLRSSGCMLFPWWHQPIYQLLAMVTFSATILNLYAAWSMTSHMCLDQDDEINHLHSQWNLISKLTEMWFIWDSWKQDFSTESEETVERLTVKNDFSV